MPPSHQQNRRLDSLDVIQEYFAKLNPIAERIYHDINEISNNYGKLWDNLNHHEQSDIINDTLIKPEISLHYFDNFPTPTQSTSTKSHTSTDSLAIVVLGDLQNHKDNDAKNNKQLLPLKQCYGFDGRDLRSFSIQTVALKIIQDDAIGSFRDEYSGPFSYRTKSQINLHLFHGDAAASRTVGNYRMTALPIKDSKQEPMPMDAESKKALLNYQRLQCELKKSLNQKSRPSDSQKSSNVSIKPNSISSPPSDAVKTGKSVNKQECTSYTDKEKISCPKSKPSKSSSSIMQVFLNSNNSSAPPSSSIVNYAVYTDSFLDGGENTNLMQNCGRGEFMSASSSSAATSEDDEYDGITDKTLDSEEVYLLDRDMRRGFDFLNNW